jgi:hypothetical protein
MILDRDYQLRLLKMLCDAYPNEFDHRNFCHSLDENTGSKYEANMIYLEEHGLVKSGIVDHVFNPPRITAKGMDFLADDGGLTAILGVTTIRFDDNILRAIIETKINNTPGLADKPGMISRLRELPADAIKHLTLVVLEKGLDQLPNAISLIESMFRSS